MKSYQIKKRMKKMGITQFYAAYKLKISQSALCQKINGQRGFKLPELHSLAKLMQLTDAEFIELFFLP